MGGVSATCIALGDYPRAQRFADRLHTIALELKAPKLMASSLTMSGMSFINTGRYEQASIAFRSALQLYEQLDDDAATAEVCMQLGIALSNLMQAEEFLKYAERAHELYERLGRRGDAAFVRTFVAAHLADLGKMPNATLKALKQIKEALAVQLEIGDIGRIGLAYDGLGSTYDAQGDRERAVAAYEKAIRPYERSGNLGNLSVLLARLANCCVSASDLTSALRFRMQALEVAESDVNPGNLAVAHDGLAWTLIRLGRHAEALGHYEKAMSELAQVGRRTFSEDKQAAFLDGWESVLPSVSRCVVELQESSPSAAARGFPIVDAFLARTLLERLHEQADASLDVVAPELARRKDEVLGRLGRLRVALDRSMGSELSRANEVAAIRRQLVEATREWTEIEEDLRRRNPKLGALIAPEPVSLQTIQTRILSETDALILYVLDEAASYAWVVTTHHAKVVTLAPQGELAAAYDRLAACLSDLEHPDSSFVEPARELHRMLIEPCRSLLGAASNWIIVPDAFLGFLPFEVLLVRDVPSSEREEFGRLPYLLRDRTIRYAPSPSLLAWTRERAPAAGEWRKELLAFGDPIYASDLRDEAAIARRARGRLAAEGFARLAKTRDEVISIAEMVARNTEPRERDALLRLPRSGHASGSGFDVYVGRDATKAQLVRDLRGYRFLHLAVHGYVDTEYPWFSGLVLSDDGDAGSGGFVNLIELGALDLDSEVAFLSACETAHGSSSTAEGIKSTARSLLLAGSRSVVATQWAVADEAAPIIARAFYERVLAGMSPGEALRQAKLWLLESTDAGTVAPRGVGGVTSTPAAAMARRPWSHPAFWAAFVIWG